MAEHASPAFKIERLPEGLQKTFQALYSNGSAIETCLHPDEIYQGDARELLLKIEPNSVALTQVSHQSSFSNHKAWRFLSYQHRRYFGFQRP